MAECKKAGAAKAIKKKTSSKKVNWQKKSTGGPMRSNPTIRGQGIVMANRLR